MPPDAEDRDSPPIDPASTVTTKIEEAKVEERVAIGAHIVYETIRREGQDELNRPSSALAWSGLAAGLSMGFSLVAEGLLAAHLPHQNWVPLISKLGYSVGFLIVVLGRQQLFTETTLTVILPLLSVKTWRNGLSVLRLWSVVLTSNLVGTFLFALCIARVAIFDPHIRQAMIQVSQERLSGGFGVVMMRAIFAGWLIALMVWLLPWAESARASIVIIITYLIGLGNFNHIIAGSTKMFFLVASGSETWGFYFLHFFLPTLIGNIIGGVSLVAFLGHAQVVAGKASS
ncbi:MAG TPA: formate/nitrite transporter family protein [Candidatus Acidoferrales bacterium]|nr:formate/nitrite transporter family protein [Candidatus Acidoferrales bacterium]